jgi:nucleotide-binding universal stress UspA family protein
MMKTLLYPTRGGRSSYRNQDRAIALAKEHGAKLCFFHVTDIRFLDHIAAPILINVVQEMDELAEFLLMMAQERAEEAGVTADYVVGQGEFRQALKEVITADAEITAVALGTPAGSTGLTTIDYLRKLAQELVDELGVEVIVFDAGDIVTHFKAEEG